MLRIAIALTLVLHVATGNADATYRHKPCWPVRGIDWANHWFPWPRDMAPSPRGFRLRDGEVAVTYDSKGHVNNIGVVLESVSYGDLTGDGCDEAIVFVSFVTGGSAIPGCLYVFGADGGRPRFLWSRSTGDRSEGGLRRVYISDLALVLELNHAKPLDAACCPSEYTRERYRWSRGKIRLVDRSDPMPLPAEGRQSN